jgi:hypothetical protein
MSSGRLLSIIASVVMLGAVLGGWYVMGSPLHQRELRLDNQRVLALSMAANDIHQYWHRHHALPDDLNAADVPAHWRSDPVSGKAYVYNRLDQENYSLCADFDAASAAEDIGEGVPHTYVPEESTWKHPAGTHCFSLAASKTASGE